MFHEGDSNVIVSYFCQLSCLGGEDLSELMSVRVGDIFSADIQNKGRDANQNKVSASCCLVGGNPVMWESLVINFAQRKKNSDVWKLKQIVLTHNEREVLNNWLSFIQASIEGKLIPVFNMYSTWKWPR